MKRITLKNTLLTALLIVAFTGNAFAAKQNVTAPDGFETVKTRQLDNAWVNPEFNPKDYETVVVKWGNFDYKPAKKFYGHQRILNDNFELAAWAKVKMQDDAHTEFAKTLAKVDDFKLIDIEEADQRTMGVNLTLTDIVNHVPNTMGVGGRYDVYVRDFGAMTLNVEFTDLTTGELLFKGNVRETVEARGVDFERATPFLAAHQTKWRLKRWATGLEKGLDKMK